MNKTLLPLLAAPLTITCSVAALIFTVGTTGFMRFASSRGVADHDFVSCDKSLRESGGFLCESDAAWNRKREILLTQRRAEKSTPKQRARKTLAKYWQTFHEPEFACSFEKRLGRTGDGGKWICDPHLIKNGPEDDCVVFSIGSNNDFSFEEAIHSELPGCEIHTFDHTVVDPSIPPYVNYHFLGVGPRDDPDNKIMSLSGLRRASGDPKGWDRPIEILKIDVEKHEYASLMPALAKGHFRGVRQVLIEVHAPLSVDGSNPGEGYDQMDEFFRLFAKAGFVITHKEPNLLHPRCVEFAFLHLDLEGV
mmetsp:Transcript_20630/g.50525  ORF Transcript_20630/g.50525 Transcript_20630/m.50525 type:complete len:307 (+) Transcript_20630:194-1114(+)